MTITSFDGDNVATRYNRIVPTCQGYFIELEEKDIVKEYLEPKEFPEKGEESWWTPGLSVFRLTRTDHRTAPRAHRFAFKPLTNFTGRFNPHRLEKFYINAYQARFLVDY